jgi:hypothetical protein
MSKSFWMATWAIWLVVSLLVDGADAGHWHRLHRRPTPALAGRCSVAPALLGLVDANNRPARVPAESS